MEKKYFLIVCLLAFSVKSETQRAEKTLYVEKQAEYMQLGSHPLLSMKLLSGSKETYSKCKVLPTPINHYVEIPFKHNFPYKFAEKSYFQTIYYDNNKNFILFRSNENEKIYAFDISSKTSLNHAPVEWKLGSHIKSITNRDIKFEKDLSEKNFNQKKGSHVAFLHNGDMILIIHFNNKLEKLNHWHFKIGYKNIKRILFHDKNIYLLLPQKIVKLSYPKGFGQQPEKKEIKLKREYNDMAMTREGVFLFVRGYSNLIASKEFNPEHSSAVVDHQKFHHGNFLSTGYSNFVLNKTHDVAQNPRYYYFENEDFKNLENFKHILKHKEIPKLSTESHHRIRMVQTKQYIYYMYPRDAKIKFIELYVKNSEFGKNLMRNHIAGHVESLAAGYSSFFPENRLVIEKQDPKISKSKLSRIYSNFLDSTVKCNPMSPKQKKEEVEFEVVSTATRFKLKVVFGPKPWRKLVGKEKPKPSNKKKKEDPNKNKKKEDPNKNKKKEDPNKNKKNDDPKKNKNNTVDDDMPFVKLVIIITGGTLIGILVLGFLRWVKIKIFSRNRRETEDIVNEITASEDTRREFEMNETIESESDVDTDVDTSDAEFEMTI